MRMQIHFLFFMFELKYSLGIFKAVNSNERYNVEMLSFLTQISGRGGAEGEGVRVMAELCKSNDSLPKRA